MAEQKEKQSDFSADPGVALMLAYQGGDERAFDELVERYSSMAWSLLTRFLGQQGVREDLVQEAFLQVVLELPSWLILSARFSFYKRIILFVVNSTGSYSIASYIFTTPIRCSIFC